jgi:hypothetical protein
MPRPKAHRLVFAVPHPLSQASGRARVTNPGHAASTRGRVSRLGPASVSCVFASNTEAVKSRNLDDDGSCWAGLDLEPLHIALADGA